MTNNEQRTTNNAPFDQWAQSLESQTNTCTPRIDTGVLFDYGYACTYLANTRTLAALAIRSGIGDLSEQARDKALAILEQQVEALGEAVRQINAVSWVPQASPASTYSDELTRLVWAIRQLAELENARIELSQEGVSNP